MKFDLKACLVDSHVGDNAADFAVKMFGDYCKPKDISISYKNGNIPHIVLTNPNGKVLIDGDEIKYNDEGFSFRYYGEIVEARLLTPDGVYYARCIFGMNKICYYFYDAEALENMKYIYEKKFGKNNNNLLFTNFRELYFLPDAIFETEKISDKDEIVDEFRKIFSNPEVIVEKIINKQNSLKKTNK